MKRILILVIPVAVVALASPAQAAPSPSPKAVANVQQGCAAVTAALEGPAEASFARADRGLVGFLGVAGAFGCIQ